MQAWMLKDAVVEKEVYDARQQAKSEIARMLGTDPLGSYLKHDDDKPDDGGFGVGIRYDEYGAPRPNIPGYDGSHSDGPPKRRATRTRPLPPETVPTDDYDSPFPGLDPPLGNL